ncbi:phosphatase PAP2 family protein [Rhizobium tubonense]|uniref:Phosphatidic acid phosphatase n=1 Tax=Rhizobium tubonense TaxID=484088 RepID=A0A2W4C8L3_9HYPH|nr:phosphatase PAP2 family protein [Rhizobium tubonense]PZM09752.1 phosphatidic acid phosphatase [Rhizobium tubonense]
MNDDSIRPAAPPIVGRQSLWGRLSRRYAARRSLHVRIPWVGYAFTSINIVAIAFFVFDAPLGAAAKGLPARLVRFAGEVTDVGRLVSILVAVCAVLIVGLLLTRRLSKLQRRFRVAYFIRATVYVAISVISASIAVHILKYAIGRARPPLFDAVGIFHLEPFNGDFLYQSFPSAHATHIGAFFAALALLFPRFRLVFAGLGLWLGVTRIIVGVHYPSDVAAGLALGVWFAFATAFIFSRFGLLFSLAHNGTPTPRRTLANS